MIPVDDQSIYLDDEFDSEQLYESLLDSDHLEERGYETHNCRVDYEEGTREVNGVTLEGETDAVDRYHAQFAELEEDGLWVHVDVPGGSTDELTYMVTMGDSTMIEEDLATAVSEIQDDLSE